jgi:ribonuclease HI
VDFLAELTHPKSENPGEWTIYINGSLITKGCRVGVILEIQEGVSVEYSLKFDFPTSNNQAEYQVCLVGIRMAKDLGASAITLCSD